MKLKTVSEIREAMILHRKREMAYIGIAYSSYDNQYGYAKTKDGKYEIKIEKSLFVSPEECSKEADSKLFKLLMDNGVLDKEIGKRYEE